MTLFKKAESTSAYLKAGFLGFAGSGKTFTATQLAIGLAKLINERKLKEAGRPIFFLDTETGSDYVTDRVRSAGLELYTAKTRAFVDLLEAIRECEQSGSVLIIDSITHFWREFTDAYRKKKNRTRLEMLDWATLKTEWGRFTDSYVNSNTHIVMCGRAGFEYEHEVDEVSGKKEMIKSGVKMKAEGETGYEPSILVLMEREMDVRTNTIVRTAHILKERFGVIDGKHIGNPTFEDFLPHVQRLNLGGAQLGVDTTRDSTELFNDEGDTRWRYEQRQKDIALDEIKEEIQKFCGYGQDATTKQTKADLLNEIAGTRSWAKVEAMKWPQLQVVRDALWMRVYGHAYGSQPAIAVPAAAPISDDIPMGDAPVSATPEAA